MQKFISVAAILFLVSVVVDSWKTANRAERLTFSVCMIVTVAFFWWGIVDEVN